MVSKKKCDFDAFKIFLVAGSLALSVLILAFAATPGTVLADSAFDQYTEPNLPQKPPDRGGGGAGAGSGGGAGNGAGSGDGAGAAGNSANQAQGGGGTDSGLGTDQTESGESAGGQAGESSQNEAGRGGSGGSGRVGSDGSGKPGSAQSDSEEADDALLGGTGSGGNGDGDLWLIAALILGVPLLLGGVYYLTGLYRGGREDHETRRRLREAVSGGKNGPAP